MIDEWEENAGLVFGFQCSICDDRLGYGDLPEEGAKSHEQFVKEIAKLAQVRGWTKIETFKYLCPKCANLESTQS